VGAWSNCNIITIRFELYVFESFPPVACYFAKIIFVVVFNTNADFINGLYKAEVASPTLISHGYNCEGERKKIAQKFLQERLNDPEQVNREISNIDSLIAEDQLGVLKSLTKTLKEHNLDLFAAIGATLSYCPQAFGKLFKDFSNHIIQLPRNSLINAGETNIDGRTRSPLANIIQNGIDSGKHLLEAVLKSILIQSGRDMNLGQFKQAFQHSKKLLLELTQIPLDALVDLESYLFKRPPNISGGNCSVERQKKERLGRDVNHQAISYDPEKGATLNQEFLSRDSNYLARVTATNRDHPNLKVNGCAGIQAITYFFDFIEKVFEKYLYPNFDELMNMTEF
jgi:hypothetical protein